MFMHQGEKGTSDKFRKHSRGFTKPIMMLLKTNSSHLTNEMLLGYMPFSSSLQSIQLQVQPHPGILRLNTSLQGTAVIKQDYKYAPVSVCLYLKPKTVTAIIIVILVIPYTPRNLGYGYKECAKLHYFIRKCLHVYGCSDGALSMQLFKED